MEYGNSLDSKLLTENGTNTIFWFINKIRDLNGNFIEFKYSMNDRSPRITQILYTGNFNTGTAPYNQINFSYSIRTDESEIFEAGTKISAKYLQVVIALLAGLLTKVSISTFLDFKNSAIFGASRCPLSLRGLSKSDTFAGQSLLACLTKNSVFICINLRL